MTWEKSSDFAEGDGGQSYAPGQGIRMWQEICEAKELAAKSPAKLSAKSIGEVQAEVMTIATNKSNPAGVRVDAYRLCFEMACYMADADINPVNGHG